MSHVFDGARWMSVPIGILWALLVTNLYLLLLYTISPALLPVAEKKKYTGKYKVKKTKNAINPFLSFSFLTRVGFITFLAIIIAQPFNVCFFTTNYEAADKFAITIQEILSTSPLSRVVTVAFCCIMVLPVYFKYRVRRISGKNFDNDFETSETKGIRHLREQLSHTTGHQNLARQILSIDINSIRTSDFYFQKTLLEYRIVLEEYEQFKKEYSQILTEQIAAYNLKCNHNLKYYVGKLKRLNPEKWQLLDSQIKEELKYETSEKYEYWADPPFRTSYKSAGRDLAKESDLLQMLYPDN
jgi:hypothetical protein